jgi:hypothetical protein
LLLLLLLLNVDLWLSVLAPLQSDCLAVKLHSLQLIELERIELLTSKQLRLSHHNLALWKLHQLWLPGVLEGADGSN